MMAMVLALTGLIAALVASRYWYLSAKGKVPITYITPSGVYETEIESLLRRSAAMNRIAAIWTAVASLLSALSAVVGLL